MMKWKDRVGDWDVCGFPVNDMILTILLLQDELTNFFFFGLLPIFAECKK